MSHRNQLHCKTTILKHAAPRSHSTNTTLYMYQVITYVPMIFLLSCFLKMWHVYIFCHDLMHNVIQVWLMEYNPLHRKKYKVNCSSMWHSTVQYNTLIWENSVAKTFHVQNYVLKIFHINGCYMKVYYKCLISYITMAMKYLNTENFPNYSN